MPRRKKSKIKTEKKMYPLRTTVRCLLIQGATVTVNGDSHQSITFKWRHIL